MPRLRFSNFYGKSWAAGGPQTMTKENGRKYIRDKVQSAHLAHQEHSAAPE
jgi:hypothetical protein